MCCDGEKSPVVEAGKEGWGWGGSEKGKLVEPSAGKEGWEGGIGCSSSLGEKKTSSTNKKLFEEKGVQKIS